MRPLTWHATGLSLLISGAAAAQGVTATGLQAMTPAQQAEALSAIVTGGGHACTPTDAVFRNEEAGDALWVVHCAENAGWLVQIKPDGVARVMPCDLLAALGRDCLKGP